MINPKSPPKAPRLPAGRDQPLADKIQNVTGVKFVRGHMPKRKIDANKGDNGRILIIAGSSGMAGAAILCSRAALRAGAGLVYLSVPKELKHTINCAIPEVIIFNSSPDRIGAAVIRKVKDMKIDVVAIGPGLGSKQKEFVKSLIKTDIALPMILDADALNSIADNPKILKKRKYPTVITPHPGEMARLLGTSVSEIQKNRIATAKEFAKEYGVITVLKGVNTVIADTSGKYFINPTGNAGMATAGMGDVLTGAVSALIGQAVEPFAAAVCGAFIHGAAADAAASLKGQIGLIASDVIDRLPYIINEIAG